jgi:hypothetical protein
METHRTRARDLKPRWFAILLGSALIGAACFAIFFAVSYLSIDRDASPSVERVREAFRKGQLVTDPYQEGSTGIGSHQWNDCLITLMAIDQRGDRLRLALSPIIAGVPNPPPDGNPCGVLASLVNGATPDANPYHYDRYVHGAAVLLRYLLPERSISWARGFYRSILTCLLVAGFAACLVGIARGARTALFAVLAVTFLALARFFGLESFSQSLGHGPADALIAAYALALALMLFFPTGPSIAIWSAAIFGALTIVLELFTGGGPLGLAMVIGIGTIAVRRDAQARGLTIAAAASTAFLVAGAATYACKIAAVALLSDFPILADILGELTVYSPLADREYTMGDAMAAVARSIGVLAGGMGLLSAATIAMALAAGVYGAVRLLRRGDADPMVRIRIILLAVSVVPIAAWFLVFPNHAVVHAWMTDRILVWPIAAGFAIFVLSLLDEARAKPDKDTSVESAAGESGR